MSHSNIIFSNGLLDPWSTAGVMPKKIEEEPEQWPIVANVTDDGSVIALVLRWGGHHLDLMFSHDDDPQEVIVAREIEDRFIRQWIEEWYSGKKGGCDLK